MRETLCDERKWEATAPFFRMVKKSRWNKGTQRVPEHLRSLQLLPGLEPMLLVISRFLSAGEPDLVGPGGDFCVGRRSCLLPGWSWAKQYPPLRFVLISRLPGWGNWLVLYL